jgi:hypothetical protein
MAEIYDPDRPVGEKIGGVDAVERKVAALTERTENRHFSLGF